MICFRLMLKTMTAPFCVAGTTGRSLIFIVFFACLFLFCSIHFFCCCFPFFFFFFLLLLLFSNRVPRRKATHQSLSLSAKHRCRYQRRIGAKVRKKKKWGRSIRNERKRPSNKISSLLRFGFEKNKIK